MSPYPHISNINIFDATKVVVMEQDTRGDKHGGSRSVKIEIHGDNEATTTIITVWRGSGNEAAPDLIVGNHDSDGESDP